MSKKHWLILAAVVLAVVYIENHGHQLSNLLAKVPVVGKTVTGRAA